MQFKTIALVALVGIAGCQTVPQPAVSVTAFADEKWSTGCQDDQKDPYGKLFERAKCWAMVSYFETTDFGLPIGVATIFEVDHKGSRLTQNSELDSDI